MRREAETNSIIAMCPIRNVVARFGDKWSLLVLLVIDGEGTVRFNELCRKIPDISTRVLSVTLKTLEADGLINRVCPGASESGIYVDRNRKIACSPDNAVD